MSASCIVLNPVVYEGSPAIGSMSPDRSQESILIFLTVPGSSVIPMRVHESDSISSVKLRIQSFGGFIVKKRYKLVLDGRELSRNDSRVKDYGVTDGKILHLVIRLSDVRYIAIETSCGKKFSFHVERRRSIGYVKQQITKKGKGIVELKEDHKLTCDGEELDDKQLIDEICKEGEAVIHLVISRSSKVQCMPVEKDFELSVVERLPRIGSVSIEPVAAGEVVFPKVINDLVRAVREGLEKGNPPIMSTEGSGGAYFMQDFAGQSYVAVFKPVDEEPMAENNPRGLPPSPDGEGLKKGTRVGEGAIREVAAYILDHPVSGRRSRSRTSSSEPGFSGVPPTVMARCLHEAFHHPGVFDSSGKEERNFKIGSLQMFVKNSGSCEDMGPRDFPVQEVHKIAVLDIRLANADRHSGNILISKEEEEEEEEEESRISLVPIDHGYCLPETFEDCTFEWLYWPQSREPFSRESCAYIRSLDAEEDIRLLAAHGWRISDKCARTLRLSTMLLKKGAERGLSPHEVGGTMCRETLRKESVMEEIVRQAEDAVLPGTSEAAFLECVSEIMDCYLDTFATAAAVVSSGDRSNSEKLRRLNLQEVAA